MSLNSKQGSKRSRGGVLTEEALQVLDQELIKWWDNSVLKQQSKTKKLTREAKEEGLGLEAQTIDKIYRHEPVDEVSLRHAFEKLKITPGFSKEQHCVLSLPTSGNLPRRSTPCIGREAQVAEISTLLESTNLVTLTGAGGVGKTRLAIQVAEDTEHHYAAGLWFVKLEALTNPALVPQQIASTLGILEDPRRPLMQTLSDFLGEKSLLLILDNCEHLLEACAILADHLLTCCAYLKVLATSRERLNISSEHPYRVPSLPLPDLKKLLDEEKDITTFLLDYDAVRLFVERASVQRPNFALTPQNAVLLASVCHRLDGIPLAIELAAARMRSMTLDELSRGLDDCFRILKGGSRTVLPRHQTLRATIDWSYDLLEENQKALLARLSVFRGGWTLEAAERVCAGGELKAEEMLDMLTELSDKSLVMVEPQGETSRYRLLETVRQYAQEKLASEAGLYHLQHRNYFLALAEETEPKLTGTEQPVWLQRLEKEHENLLAALERSIGEAGYGGGLRFCGALLEFWGTRGYVSEGRVWCERALSKADAQERTQERAKVLNGAGVLAYYQGDHALAHAYYDESLSIRREIGDQRGVANSLNNLGLVAQAQGDYASALTIYNESLSLRQEMGDQGGIATSLNNLGIVAHAQGDCAYAQAMYNDSLSLWRQLGDQESISYALSGLGLVAHTQGDYISARNYLEESLSLFRTIGDRRGIAEALNGLGLVDYSQGDDASAQNKIKNSLAIRREISDRVGIAESLEAFASLMAKQQRAEQAARLWGAAELLRQDIRAPLLPNKLAEYDRDVAAACAALGEMAFKAAWVWGRTVTLEQAIEYALAKNSA